MELEYNEVNEGASSSSTTAAAETTTTTRIEDEPTIVTSNADDEVVPDKLELIDFLCSSCDLHEKCHYFGRTPPFANQIEFFEDCYVMKDPFSKQPTKLISRSDYFLVLGSECSSCKKVVCKDIECSIYYKLSYCLTCAKENIKQFPIEVQGKISKALQKIKISQASQKNKLN